MADNLDVGHGFSRIFDPQMDNAQKEKVDSQLGIQGTFSGASREGEKRHQYRLTDVSPPYSWLSSSVTIILLWVFILCNAHVSFYVSFLYVD